MDWTPTELRCVLDLAREVKKSPPQFRGLLRGKTLYMHFEKPSTRTRVSFEAGMTQLGGHAIFMPASDSNIKAGVKLEDEVRCIDRYADAIMARVRDHETVRRMAAVSSVPVINALCNRFHPCQTLADLQTIEEHFGRLEGVRIAWVGDGNNVCNTLTIGALMAGARMTVATPKDEQYRPDPEVLRWANGNPLFRWTDDPDDAVKDADVVVTDTWVSMGQEKEKAERLPIFHRFQVTRERLGHAVFLHCLPAYRGYEVTDDVIDSDQSLVFEEAENRLHAQKALLLELMH